MKILNIDLQHYIFFNRDVSIENLKMVFPYGFEFYSIFQGEFISIFKWLKLIHKKPKLQPEPLPSDIVLKVKVIRLLSQFVYTLYQCN